MLAQPHQLVVIAGAMQDSRVVLDELHVGRLRLQRPAHQRLGAIDISRRGFGDPKKMQRMNVGGIGADDAPIQFGGRCDIPFVVQGKRPIQCLPLVTHAARPTCFSRW